MVKKSGHEQALAMARLGLPKVDKSLRMPIGYGVVDKVFVGFNDRYRDEWKRRLISSEAAVGAAAEWHRALRRFPDDVVLDAAESCKRNYSMPPDLQQFISLCEVAYEAIKVSGPRRTPSVAHAALANIRAMRGNV